MSTDVFRQSKEVTIVHGDKQLLNAAYPDKYRKAIENDITARNVHLALGEYVDEIPAVGQPAVTRSGKTLDADLVVRL
jgi:apoptosis-inducing factor 2